MDFTILLDEVFLGSIARLVTPILLAALGGALCERAGVFNIGLEGLMLVGAFAAVCGSYFAGSAVGGVMAAMMASALMASVFALFAVTLRGHAIVLGIAVNLLASGLTVYLLRAIFGAKGAFRDPNLEGLADIHLPLVENVPILGPLLSGHSAIVYASWLLVVVLQVFLFRHPLGLRLRGVGEHAAAAASLGISVHRTRFLALVASGVLCGLAGAQLSLGNVTLFVENMSAGRGWIAVAAVMLGRASPLGVLGAAVLFGVSDSLGFRLQGFGLPSQATESLPYLVTLGSLFLLALVRKRRSVADSEAA